MSRQKGTGDVLGPAGERGPEVGAGGRAEVERVIVGEGVGVVLEPDGIGLGETAPETVVDAVAEHVRAAEELIGPAVTESVGSGGGTAGPDGAERGVGVTADDIAGGVEQGEHTALVVGDQVVPFSVA